MARYCDFKRAQRSRKPYGAQHHTHPKKNTLFDECVLGVRANVFTTSNELKVQATTRISRDCQLQMVSVRLSSIVVSEGDSICGSQFVTSFSVR